MLVWQESFLTTKASVSCCRLENKHLYCHRLKKWNVLINFVSWLLCCCYLCWGQPPGSGKKTRRAARSSEDWEPGSSPPCNSESSLGLPTLQGLINCISQNHCKYRKQYNKMFFFITGIFNFSFKFKFCFVPEAKKPLFTGNTSKFKLQIISCPEFLDSQSDVHWHFWATNRWSTLITLNPQRNFLFGWLLQCNLLVVAQQTYAIFYETTCKLHLSFVC